MKARIFNYTIILLVIPLEIILTSTSSLSRYSHSLNSMEVYSILDLLAFESSIDLPPGVPIKADGHGCLTQSLSPGKYSLIIYDTTGIALNLKVNNIIQENIQGMSYWCGIFDITGTNSAFPVYMWSVDNADPNLTTYHAIGYFNNISPFISNNILNQNNNKSFDFTNSSNDGIFYIIDIKYSQNTQSGNVTETITRSSGYNPQPKNYSNFIGLTLIQYVTKSDGNVNYTITNNSPGQININIFILNPKQQSLLNCQ